MSLKLRLELTGLPSPQHRAGMVGLARLLRHLESFHQLSANRLELDLDLELLVRLLGLLYQGTDAVRLRKTKPAHGKFEEVEVAQDDGRTSLRYRISQRRPAGAWLMHLPHHVSWQDSVWHTLRSVVATRKIYDQEPRELAHTLYSALRKEADGRQAWLPLAGPLYAGARSQTAERVATTARPSHILLLHFAHAVALPFRVETKHMGKTILGGNLLAYPDPDDLTRLAEPVATGERVSNIHEAGLAALKAWPGLPRVFLARFEQQGHTSVVVETLHPRRGPKMENDYARWVQPLRHPAWRAMVSENLILGRDPRHGLGRLLRTSLPESEDAGQLSRNYRTLVDGYLRAAVLRQAGYRASPSERNETRQRIARDLRRRLLAASSGQSVAALMFEMATLSKQTFDEFPSSRDVDQLLLALAACTDPFYQEIPNSDEEPIP